MLRALLLILSLAVAAAAPAQESSPPAPDAAAPMTPTLQTVLQRHADEVAKPGRRTVGTVLDALLEANPPGTADFLRAWRDKEVWRADDGGTFYRGSEAGGTLVLRDVSTGEVEIEAAGDGYTQIRPNGGVRKVLAGALVRFQLSDPSPARRARALDTVLRTPSADQIDPLRASIATEDDPALRARKERLVRMLEARFAQDAATRIAAIEGLSDDLSIEARAVLNTVLATTSGVSRALPEGANVARVLEPGRDIGWEAAYARLVEAGLAPPPVDAGDMRAALEANLIDGRVAGMHASELGTQAARAEAYARLAEDGTVPAIVTGAAMRAAVQDHVFHESFQEPDPSVTDAARTALDAVERQVGIGRAVDLGLDALSLASIYFLAAIGLAITFGVMGVINMAHGEFIMMGAYTGYVVQQVVPGYTLSLAVALPLAFAVTFAAGVAMERLVIRHLYHRPLETLLATFGISIALQQLAKNVFGTQARPLTSPDWLDGAWAISEVIQISYIRVAIFALALLFLGLLLFVLRRTRLGLEVRAVTQNPRMAASMGIDPDRINMLTFGLGSGIAGIAGVAIGLYAKVTSEMGQDYIVQSFMTVVVGGVGNVWGTLAGAGLIGILQKGIEWLNPSNTLAAQTYMILFVILFIQIRPRGLVALKGRAAGD